MFDSSVVAAYVLAHAVSGTVAALVGLWAFRHSDVTGSRTFVALMTVDALWVVAASVEIVADHPAVVVAAATARTVLALTAVVVWFRFASVYSGRSDVRDDPLAAALGLGYVALVGVAVATAPTLAVATDAPFAHAANGSDAFRAAGLAFATVGIFVGVGRLGSLFLRSRHRSSAAVLSLVVTAVAATLPLAAAEAGVVPVPTFDHTALGVGVFALGAAVSVFGRGLLAIDPVARDVLFEEFGDPVVVVDERRRLTDYNAGAAALCETLRTTDPVGRRYEDACPDLAAAAPLAAFDDGETREITLSVDDAERHYSVQCTHVSTGAGVGHTLVFRDVTDLVSYRWELERQNEQLDQFARTVTHDLRNPLNVAQGYLELVADDVAAIAGTADPERASTLGDRFDTVARTHDRMRDIVEDLRTLAEKGKSVEETERLRLSEVAETAWEGVRTDDATLSVVRDGDVVADRSRLLSIFEKLFGNSVEHAGRTVTVEVAATDDGFVVSDDGPGIPARERDRVFEYGYTTSRGGSGLGLAIVKTMARSHGWTVSVGDGDGVRVVFERVRSTPDPAPDDRVEGGEPASAGAE